MIRHPSVMKTSCCEPGNAPSTFLKKIHHPSLAYSKNNHELLPIPLDHADDRHKAQGNRSLKSRAQGHKSYSGMTIVKEVHSQTEAVQRRGCASETGAHLWCP